MRLSEDWDFYACEIDDDPSFVLVDLGARKQVPLADKPLGVRVVIEFLTPREDGLSSSEESPVLFGIEELLEEMLEEQLGAVYVGRITGGGRRELYYYAAGDQSELSLDKLSEAFPEYSVEVAAAEDPDWEQYTEVLLPNLLGWLYIKNRQLIQVLESHGDPLVTDREVDHVAFFPEEATARSFAEQIDEEDWIHVRCIEPREDEELPWAVSFGADQAITLEETNEVTYEVAIMADELGGCYDGWGCSIQPAVPAEQSAAFWTWFQEQAGRFAEHAERGDAAGLIGELDARVEEAHAGLGGLIGFKDDRHQLVITARGTRDHVYAVEALVDAAPEVKGWDVVGFRPRIDAGADLSISLDGEEVRPADVWFQAYGGPGGELGITLLVRGLSDDNREARSNAAVILMDHVVGERNAMLIDSLVVEPLADPPQEESGPLADLAGLLEQVKASREP